MFDDIIGSGKKDKSKGIKTTPEICPYCGAEEVGLSVIGIGNKTCYFCFQCGYVWDCC